MKPATTLLTIAAMAFVAQAAPVPLPNANSLAIEMPKFQERAVAGLAGGIFDQPSLHHSRSSRSIGGNDYADTLRMKRQGGAEAEAVVTTAEVVAKEGAAVVKAGQAAAQKRLFKSFTSGGGGVVKAAEVAVKEGEAVAKEGEAVAKAAGKKAKSGKPWGMLAGAAVAGGLIDHTFFSGGHESPPAASASKPATPPSNPETPPSNSATPASDPATATYPPPGSGSATPAPKYTYNGPTYAYYGPGSYPPASYPPASYPPASKKRDVVDTPSVGRFGALDLLGEA